jgi:hypothetical protein
MTGLNFQVFGETYAGIISKFLVIIPVTFIQVTYKIPKFQALYIGYDHFIIGKNNQNSLHFRR